MPVALVDDPIGVPDNTVLYRRTSWSKIGGRPVGTGAVCVKITANFFTDAPPALAEKYDLERVCMSVGTSLYLHDDPSPMLTDWEECGLVSVTAGEVRRLQLADGSPSPQGVLLFPTGDEPWHAVVFTTTGVARASRESRAMARLAQLVRPLAT